MVKVYYNNVYGLRSNQSIDFTDWWPRDIRARREVMTYVLLVSSFILH